jgi:hypothetical protein
MLASREQADASRHVELKALRRIAAEYERLADSLETSPPKTQ